VFAELKHVVRLAATEAILVKVVPLLVKSAKVQFVNPDDAVAVEVKAICVAVKVVIGMSRVKTAVPEVFVALDVRASLECVA
jgi:hypothetical protein